MRSRSPSTSDSPPRPVPNDRSATRIVLSIDGGGMYGVVPAEWCAHLEHLTGRPLADQVDLMVGTSTGAIIAAALGVGTKASDLVRLYLSRGQDIFRRSRPAWRRLTRPQYPDGQLKGVLTDYLGRSLPMSEARTKLMVCAYDMNAEAPAFHKSWTDEDAATPLVDAVCGSSTVPTMFAMHPVQRACSAGCMVDGGVIGAGNPVMCALAEALRLFPDDRILVISLGTGYIPHPENQQCTRKKRNWGLVKWAQALVGVVLDGASDMAIYQAQRVAEALPERVQVIRLDVEIPGYVATSKRADMADESVLRAMANVAAERRAGQVEVIANMIAEAHAEAHA